MPRRIRHRTSRLLRASLLALFALCVVMQPVVAAWGELHEFVAHAGSADGHGGHSLSHAEDEVVPDEDAGAGAPGHALLHHAHCCSQGQLAVVPVSLPMLSFPTGRSPRTVASAPAVDAPSQSPFRPPIRV